jgi:hypothetical protein
MAGRNVPATNGALEVDVIPAKEFYTFSRDEYDTYCESKGTYLGRKEGQKTTLSTQELRILINEKWTPEEVMKKHGINDEELKQVVWALSKEEQREKPIKFGKL